MAQSQEGGSNMQTAEEEKEQINDDQGEDKVSLMLEIARVQFFVIKNDQRRQLASGKLQIITDEPDHNELVFTFPDYVQITHSLAINSRRPVIKMCETDYIFINGADSFGLYVDLKPFDPSVLRRFEEVIKPYCYLKSSSKALSIHKYPINEKLTVGPPDSVAEAGMKLAALICRGSVATARGIRKVTIMGSSGINKSKRYLTQKLTPVEEPVVLSPKLQNGLSKAQIGGKAVVKVSGAVLTGAIAAANALSNEVSDAVADTSYGKRIAAESGPKAKAAKEIVKSTVAGVYTVYDEAVSSALHLVKEGSHATAEVLGHKYGDEVHRAAESTADIVDSAATTVVNANMMGYKALAKRIVANTTVDVLSEETERKENQSQRVALSPAVAVKGLIVASELTSELDKQKEEKRRKRQEFVGVEPIEESEDNYKMARNNQQAQLFVQDSGSQAMYNGNAVSGQVGAAGNNSNIPNASAPVSIFEEDETLDVD